MLVGKIFRVGDEVFVKKTSRGETVEQGGTVTGLRANSGNSQTVTVEIEPDVRVETINDSDHLAW
jgi:hypothetical protein